MPLRCSRLAASRKSFGGRCRPRAARGAGGFLARDRRRAAVDHRHRRRERQRQDDTGAAAAGPGRADRGPGALPGARSATRSDRTAAQIPARRPGDLPGPVRGLQSVLPRGSRADHAGARSSVSPRRRAEARGADRGDACARSACARRRSSAAIRISSAAASASASWWRARCCCGRT